MKEKTDVVPKQMIYLLFLCATLLAALMYLPQPRMAPFISAEVQFYDPSTHGLKIMPASCASNPSWYHGALTAAGDGYGLISVNGTTEYGAWAAAGMYICVTNSSGSNVFVPAKTSAELNAFKATPAAGVSAW